MRDKHFEYKKADVTFAEFKLNREFIKLKSKALNKKEFLRNVEAQIFPDSATDKLDHSEFSSLSGSKNCNKRETKRKNKRLTSGNSYFQSVTISGHLYYPDFINNLLNPDIPLPVLRYFQVLVSIDLKNNPNIADQVIKFNYKNLHSELDKLNDAFHVFNFSHAQDRID